MIFPYRITSPGPFSPFAGIPHLKEQWLDSRLHDDQLPTVPPSAIRAAIYRLRKLLDDGQVLMDTMMVDDGGEVLMDTMMVDDDGVERNGAAQPAKDVGDGATRESLRRELSTVMEAIRLDISVYEQFVGN